MSTEEAVVSTVPQCSLYVGDLHPSVDERLLYAKFGEIGPVHCTRICRDITTRNSLGYAYVNFVDYKDAERALEVMNYELFCNRPIRLMWSQRDPSLRKSGKGNIFIKNLAKSIKQKELFDTFGFFGKILSCKIAMDDQGSSKGFGYVHYESEESADRAIDTLNGMSVRDRIIYVGHFVPHTARKSQGCKQRFNNIYVKSFPPETTNETLAEMFGEFGEVQSSCVAVDSEGKSKGFGFVCFFNPDHAEAAVKGMHGKDTGGRQLYVNRAQRKEERQEELKQRLEKQKAERQSKYVRGVNLYVKNLDDTVDDAKLEQAFSSYGSITSAKVMRDAQGRSKGFGFVCFTQADEATRAVVEMCNTLVGSKPLYVALAQRKDERREQILKGFNHRLAGVQRTGIAPMISAPAQAYFPQATFPRTPPYYHPSGMMGSQPRWNRAAGLPGAVQPQFGVPVRHLSSQYVGAPNPVSGMNANQMTHFTHLRSPANIGRPMLQTATPVAHMATNGMLQAPTNQVRQVGIRPGVSIPQVMTASNGGVGQRLSVASVVANGPTGVRPVAPQPPRSIGQASMVGMGPVAANVRFNQTARNVSGQPIASPNITPGLTPLGDQVPLSSGYLEQLSVEDRKCTLGERLFPLIRELYPSRAAKLTGMLLGLESSEITHLLQSRDSLKTKLEEAITVLNSGSIPASESDGARASTATVNTVAAAPNQSSDGSANNIDPTLSNRGDVDDVTTNMARKEIDA